MLPGPVYTVQNSSGNVYGFYELPQVGMSVEVWACEIRELLADILDINGVREAPLQYPDGHGDYAKIPRVIIDIEVLGSNKEERLRLVHDTIGRIAAEHSLPNA